MHIKPNNANNLKFLPNWNFYYLTNSLYFDIMKLQEAWTLKEEYAVGAKSKLKDHI